MSKPITYQFKTINKNDVEVLSRVIQNKNLPITDNKSNHNSFHHLFKQIKSNFSHGVDKFPKLGISGGDNNVTQAKKRLDSILKQKDIKSNKSNISLEQSDNSKEGQYYQFNKRGIKRNPNNEKKQMNFLDPNNIFITNKDNGLTSNNRSYTSQKTPSKFTYRNSDLISKLKTQYLPQQQNRKTSFNINKNQWMSNKSDNSSDNVQNRVITSNNKFQIHQRQDRANKYHYLNHFDHQDGGNYSHHKNNCQDLKDNYTSPISYNSGSYSKDQTMDYTPNYSGLSNTYTVNNSFTSQIKPSSSYTQLRQENDKKQQQRMKQKKILELQQQITEIKNQNIMIDKLNKKYENQYKQIQQTNKQLKNSNKKLQYQYNQIKNNYQQLKQSTNKLIKQNSQKYINNQDNKEIKNQCNKLENKIKEFQSIINKLQNQNQNYLNQNNKFADQCTLLQKQNNELQNSIQLLSTQNNTLKQSNKILDNEIKLKKTKEEQQKAKVSKPTIDPAVLMRKYQQLLRKQKEDHQSYIIETNEMIDQNKKEIDELKSKLEQKQKKLISLIKQVGDKINDEYDVKRQQKQQQMKRQNDELGIKLTEKQQQIQKLTKQIERNSQKIKTLDATIQQQKNELICLKKSVQQLQKQKYLNFDEILLTQMKKINQLKQKIQHMCDHSNQLSQKIIQLQKKNQQLNTRIKITQVKHKSQLGNLRIQHQIAIKNNQNIIKTLTNKIGTMETKYKSALNQIKIKDQFFKQHLMGKTDQKQIKQFIESVLNKYQQVFSTTKEEQMNQELEKCIKKISMYEKYA